MNEWLSLCFPSPGGPGRGLCAHSPLYLRVSTIIPICWTEGEREREYSPPPHTYPQLKLQTQTASNTSSDPTFQMGLSPASFKLLPGVACLHLKSLHISWILSLLHSGLLTSGTCFLGHQHLLIPNQTTLRGLTFSFALNRPVLPQVFSLSPPLIPCCSLCVSSACLLCQLSKYQGFQKVLILVPKHASLPLGNLIHLHRFNYYLLSEEYTGAIPGLSLKYQTLTFNEL